MPSFRAASSFPDHDESGRGERPGMPADRCLDAGRTGDGIDAEFRHRMPVPGNHRREQDERRHRSPVGCHEAKAQQLPEGGAGVAVGRESRRPAVEKLVTCLAFFSLGCYNSSGLIHNYR